MRAKLFRLNVPDDRLKALTRSLSPTHGLVEGAETAPAQGLGVGSDTLTSNGNGSKATTIASTSESSDVVQATTIASVDPSLYHLPPTETAAESVSETVVGNGMDHSGTSTSASCSGTVGATSSSSSGSSTGGGAEWVEVGIGPVRLLKPKHILSAHSHTFGVSDDVGTNMGGSFNGGGGGSGGGIGGGGGSGGGGDSSDTTHPSAPGTTPTSTSTTSSPNRVKRETCRLVMRREVSNAHVF